MKILLLSLFVAAAFAAPAPLDEEIGEPVELIVNGVAEGEPLEIGDVLGIKVKEHAAGAIVSATDLLHPLTAVGIEEAAAANPKPVEIVQLPEVVEIQPEPVELPPPVFPGVVPLPPPVFPGVVPLPPINIPAQIEPVVPLPPINIPALIPDIVDIPAVSPEIVPQPIEVPEFLLPEIQPAEVLPAPAPQIPTGEVFNNGMVQVHLNAPEHGVLSTVQSWFNMVVNYFSGAEVSSHQIV